jgi:ABC-type Zn uptake system ZnuABC Zn-binding protein ZnuA
MYCFRLQIIRFATFLAVGCFGATCLAQVVVVSLPPYASLIEQIVGNRMVVHTLLPSGVSPHTFDPSPRDILLLAKADLVVLNGGIDSWLWDLITASETRATVVKILGELSDLPISSAVEHHDDREPADENPPFSRNPHLWLDPVLMFQVVDLLEGKLTEIDPDRRDEYSLNASSLRQKLQNLNEELSETLALVAGQPFVPYHDAWFYFAARYDLDLVVTIEPFAGREPSPAYLAEALGVVSSSGARVIFGEYQLDPRPAELVAESAGVVLVILDPLGGLAGRQSYQDLLRYNAESIARALGR